MRTRPGSGSLVLIVLTACVRPTEDLRGFNLILQILYISLFRGENQGLSLYVFIKKNTCTKKMLGNI